jgi:xanthine dehydrogenase accessory factor
MTIPTLVPTPGGVAEALAAAADCARRGLRGAMATVTSRRGSTPSTPGQKIFAATDGTCVGSVGGGAVEREVVVTLESLLRSAETHHETRSFELGAELGMCCGGRVEVFVETVEGVVPCLIVGGGHVATALAPLLARLGYAVTVVDEREEWGKPDRIPGVRCVHGDYDDTRCGMTPEDAPRTAVLVMTHDHALDHDVIEWALGRRAAFVGAIGSRAKVKKTQDRLEAKGFSAEDRARVRMPLGVDIGARLPDEIAVSIAAEMVAWRRMGNAAAGGLMR